ncbi:MAG: aminotransferase [Gammaproteobacteria bacterium]|nr:MAG: aminotransferase [Gammaproteobacteria bacterium]
MEGRKPLPKILLLQIRDQEQVRREEFESFVRYSGLQKDQFDVLNVFDRPFFGPDVLEGYDALFVGGASEANVLMPDKYPFVESAERLLLSCVRQNIPVFASCFGFQLAVLALGGEIEHQEEGFEMGTLPIELADSAAHDPLFHDTPNHFMAVSVHQQKATKLPEQCQLLAFTSQCVHVFKVINKPFWAFQFHPEVDRACLVERLTFYREKYTSSIAHLDKVLSTVSETPESNELVRKFVDRVLLA